MADRHMTLDEVEALAKAALRAAGAQESAAAAVARSTRLAERDGIRSHGLLYIPIYAEHLRCGKVDASAVPVVTQPRPASIRVDAANGFAHTAIDAGWQDFTAAARTCGMAALTLHRSYNCGVLGHHAERLAEAGLLGLCFRSPPSAQAMASSTEVLPWPFFPPITVSPIGEGSRWKAFTLFTFSIWTEAIRSFPSGCVFVLIQLSFG